MRNKQRALILDSLAKVTGKSFVAYCIDLFVKEAHMKSDRDITLMVIGLQDQARDNRQAMQEILGDQFEFLMAQKFTPQFAEA